MQQVNRPNNMEITASATVAAWSFGVRRHASCRPPSPITKTTTPSITRANLCVCARGGGGTAGGTHKKTRRQAKKSNTTERNTKSRTTMKRGAGCTISHTPVRSVDSRALYGFKAASLLAIVLSCCTHEVWEAPPVPVT